MDIDEAYELHFKDVFRYVFSLSNNYQIAEDVTQETFLKAMRDIKTYDGKKDIRAWLFVIARNTYFSYCRKNKHLSITQPLDVQSDFSFTDAIYDADQAWHIHQFLHRMDDPYKEVFTLRVFGELSFEQIGSLFGKKGGWARVTFYRAKLKILDYIKEDKN